MDRRSWSLLVLLASIWGASYLLIKIGLRGMDPSLVAWGRVTLAAAVLIPVALHQGALTGVRGRWGVIGLVAAVQVAGPFLLIALGEEEIDSGLAGILVASAPIFTALLAIRFEPAERSGGLRLAGIVIGLVGVGALLGLDLAGSTAELLGGLAVLLAGLGYAVGGLIFKRRLGDLDPTGAAALVMVASSISLVPIAALSLPDTAPGAGPVVAVVVLGAIGTGLAFAIFYALMGRVGVSRTFVVAYLAPAFAVAYGVGFLDESVGAAAIAGLALILAGSWLAVEGRLPWAQRTVVVEGAPPPVPPDRRALDGQDPAAASRRSGATR